LIPINELDLVSLYHDHERTLRTPAERFVTVERRIVKRWLLFSRDVPKLFLLAFQLLNDDILALLISKF